MILNDSRSIGRYWLNARLTYWACLILFILTLTVYYQVRHFEFINYDDTGYVTTNPYVVKGLTSETFRWAWLSEVVANWHPLTMLSHLLDVTLYGLNSGAHHITNVQFHLINTILMFLVFYRMHIGLWQAFMIAAIFALHPLHVESVAWISERKDVLSAFFWLLTMLCYISYTEHPNRLRYWQTLLLFAFGLLSKPMVVTLPFVLLLMDFWPLKRMENESFLFLCLEKLPFIAVTVCFSIITFFIQQLTGAVVTLSSVPWFVRAANTFVSYMTYLIQTFWPVGLSIYYPYPDFISLPRYLISAGMILILSIIFYGYRNRFPYSFFGWFWFIGTLVPVIGLVQVGTQAHADRYMYLPMTGILVLVICGFSELFKKTNAHRKLIVILSVSIIAILSQLGYQQIARWKNPLTLFSQAAQNTKDNTLAYFCMGGYFYGTGRWEEAEQMFQKVLQYTPEYAHARLLLLSVYEKLGKKEEEYTQYEYFLEKQPKTDRIQSQIAIMYLNKREYRLAKEYALRGITFNPADPMGYMYFAIAESEIGNPFDGLSYFLKAESLDPNNAVIQNNIAIAYKKLDKLQDAIEHFGRALTLDPPNQTFLEQYRNALQERKALRNKAAEIESRLSEKPDDSEGYYDLAKIYSLLQVSDKELENLEAAVRTKPDFQEVQAQLGITYAKRGRYDDALSVFQKLSNMEPNEPQWDYRIATVQARMGNAQAACANLQSAIEKGYPNNDKVKTDLNFDPIRESECFRAIVDHQ